MPRPKLRTVTLDEVNITRDGDYAIFHYVDPSMDGGMIRDQKLSQNQLRLLAMARQQEGRLTSAQYQKLAALDIYAASRDIKELIRKGLIRLEKKGGRVYRLGQEELGTPPEDFERLAPVLAQEGRLVNGDLRRIWGVERQAALRRVRGLLESGWLAAKGNRRGRYYVAGQRAG